MLEVLGLHLKPKEDRAYKCDRLGQKAEGEWVVTFFPFLRCYSKSRIGIKKLAQGRDPKKFTLLADD